MDGAHRLQGQPGKSPAEADAGDRHAGQEQQAHMLIVAQQPIDGRKRTRDLDVQRAVVKLAEPDGPDFRQGRGPSRRSAGEVGQLAGPEIGRAEDRPAGIIVDLEEIKGGIDFRVRPDAPVHLRSERVAGAGPSRSLISTYSAWLRRSRPAIASRDRRDPPTARTGPWSR